MVTVWHNNKVRICNTYVLLFIFTTFILHMSSLYLDKEIETEIETSYYSLYAQRCLWPFSLY